jgi:hypothetical protein
MSDHLGQAGKADVLAGYFTHYNPKTVIETGVWEGWGSCFQFHTRANVIAIEQNDDSAERARANGYNVITGDSATVLPQLIAQLDHPVMFWLDAHTVEWIDGHGSCPLLDELQVIREWEHGPASVVLIDDVRMMDEPGWPGLPAVLAAAGDTWQHVVEDDILRLTPW